MIGRKLRGLLLAPDQRVLRAEARFFDAYCRGGFRAPGDLVIPIGFFTRGRVKTVLREWLLDEAPLDLEALCAEWHAAVAPDACREERLFFKNLVDFVVILKSGAPMRASIRRALDAVDRLPPKPWHHQRRDG